MKREDIKAILPDATDEQIDSILNQHGSELNAVKAQLTSAQQAATEAQAQHTAALNEQKTEYERQIAELTQKVQAGMSEEERLQAAVEAANQEKAAFKLKSNTLDAKTVFVAAGLTEEEYTPLLDQVVVDDGEKTKANAETIVALLAKQKEVVETATKDAVLKGNPSPGGSAGESKVTKEAFDKMSPSEMIKLKAENPELVASFIKG